MMPATPFSYLTRAEWGGLWIGTPPFEKMPDGETYIHHVGGTAFMGGTVAVGLTASKAAAIRVFRSLNEYAQRLKILGGKGYQFLDYDLLVWYDRFNNRTWIAEGRGQYRSAATLDRNEEGEAVCICGNFQLREPYPAEIAGAAIATAIGIDNGWISRDTKILGHRDNPAHPNATRCPGDLYYPRLPLIRDWLAELLADPVRPVPTPTPMEVIDVIKYESIRDVWVAPSVADVVDGGDSDRWLDAIILKCGSIADVQRRHPVSCEVTGLYDQATAEAYAAELAAMKATATT